MWLLACGASDDEEVDVDTGFCADVAVSTWDNFGAGFISGNCQSCHASTTATRHGAPDEVTFDDEEEVLAQADRILARATGEDPGMPPQGGVGDDDRYRLGVWLRCFAD